MAERRVTALVAAVADATATNLHPRSVHPRKEPSGLHPSVRNVHLRIVLIARTGSAAVVAATRTPNADPVHPVTMPTLRRKPTRRRKYASRLASRGVTEARAKVRERKAERAMSAKTARRPIWIRASAGRDAIAHRWRAIKVRSAALCRLQSRSRKPPQAR